MGTRIEPREGLEIFAIDEGLIAVQQLSVMDPKAGGPIVLIHPDDVESVIAGIREALRDLTDERV